MTLHWGPLDLQRNDALVGKNHLASIWVGETNIIPFLSGVLICDTLWWPKGLQSAIMFGLEVFSQDNEAQLKETYSNAPNALKCEISDGKINLSGSETCCQVCK